VLRWDMSVVGPRPPLPREVTKYDHLVHGKLLVLSGITGLWQISGRSDLSWEDSVRLDLSYVEDCLLISDLMIAFKTMFVVLRGSGGLLTDSVGSELLGGRRPHGDVVGAVAAGG